MPGLTQGNGRVKKRKRIEETSSKLRVKRRAVATSPSPKDDFQSHLLDLETQINESRLYYNNVVTLITYLRDDVSGDQRDLAAAVALCRVFCRLMAAGSLAKSREAPDNELIIAEWLKSRFQEYTQILLDLLIRVDLVKQSAALTLLMRLVKDSAAHRTASENSVWRDGLFTMVIKGIIGAEAGKHVRAEFVERYVEKYDDVRFYTFSALA